MNTSTILHSSFFILNSLAVAGCCCCTAPETAGKAPIPQVDSPSCRADRFDFKLGVARYTMHAMEKSRALDLMARIDCHYIGLNDSWIKRDASDAEIAALKAECAAKGVEIVSAGPLYYNTEEQLEACCRFAKRYGMKYISVVPYEWNPKIAHLGNGQDEATYAKRKEILPEAREWRVESDRMMDALDRMVKKYDLRAAVHNHGPDNAYLYPTGEASLKRIAGRDRRIGVCIDIGHERRAGLDPVKFIRENSDRVVEVHLKNIKIDPVKNFAKEGPRGELDIPGVFKALAETGFNGYCLVEYEKDFDANELPLAESFGYYRGVCDGISVKAVQQPVPADANQLTAEEKAEGYELMFDGKNLPKDKFVGVKTDCKAFPDHGWYVRDGYLSMYPMRGISPEGKWFPLPPEDQKLAGGGDLVTAKLYKDFVFKFDFRVNWAANSGVKYFYNHGQHQNSCMEYQILDPGHPDYDKPNPSGVEGTHRVAALYDLAATPKAEKAVYKTGYWNHGMIVSKGRHVEHWLNGVKVFEYERGSADFRKWVAGSKYAAWEDKGSHWGEAETGRILLQDHSDSTVSFCNLKLKELK